MSDEGQRQYFNLIPPQESTTPGTGVTWLATSTTAAVYDLSTFPNMFGKLLTLIASGGKVWISTSNDGVTAIDKATVAGASITAGTVKAAPIPLGDGVATMMRLDRKANRYLHVQADAGTPTLIIFPSSQVKMSDMSGG